MMELNNSGYELLREGKVGEFNDLRQKNSGWKPNFRGRDLRGFNLRGADLRGADLRDAYLEGVYLEQTHLEVAYLQDTHLRGIVNLDQM